MCVKGRARNKLVLWSQSVAEIPLDYAAGGIVHFCFISA